MGQEGRGTVMQANRLERLCDGMLNRMSRQKGKEWVKNLDSRNASKRFDIL